jgi:drug/metabolite transporter (DMT)-like permease
MKLSFWQEVCFSITFGVLVAIGSMFWGKEYFAWAYLVGALYSLLGYNLLEWCIENLGSLFWEEDEMPKKVRPWMHGAAPISPVVAVIVVSAIGIGFGWAYLKYEYDKLVGHVKIT